MSEHKFRAPTTDELAKGTGLREVKPGDPAPTAPAITKEELIKKIQDAHRKMGGGDG